VKRKEREKSYDMNMNSIRKLKIKFLKNSENAISIFSRFTPQKAIITKKNKREKFS